VTNRDRDSLAKHLSTVVDRLLLAPQQAIDDADRRADSEPPGTSPYAYQAGALGQVCRNEAHAIQTFVTSYLTPKARQRRGRR
jgi:hypothetical protein